MFSLLFRIVALAVALQISGGHWTVLQSVAWLGMVVTYAQEDSSLAGAVAKTFDGQHPCDLCEVVKTGRAVDRDHDITKRVIKMEVVLIAHCELLLPRVTTTRLKEHPVVFSGRLADSVPTPPPRLA